MVHVVVMETITNIPHYSCEITQEVTEMETINSNESLYRFHKIATDK